jgi:hypothetical protein
MGHLHMNQQEFDDLDRQQDAEDQRSIKPDQTQETDPIQLLCDRLGKIEGALQ